jgi:hypothetical protein
MQARNYSSGSSEAAQLRSVRRKNDGQVAAKTLSPFLDPRRAQERDRSCTILSSAKEFIGVSRLVR